MESRLPSELREDHNIWEPAHVATQTSWVGASPILLVSVLLTDDTPTIKEQTTEITWSNRDPIYDGVIEYPNGLTLVIENKPDNHQVKEYQLHPSKASFPDGTNDIKLHNRPICLEWSEILEGVLKYINSPMSSFSSREIGRDFLSFVEKNHSELTPYRTFRLCGDRFKALKRRTLHLVDEIAELTNVRYKGEDEGGYLCRPGKTAERIRFRVRTSEGEPWTLRVSLYPASTASQANRFRKRVRRQDFLSLGEKGWDVEPDLNFAFPMGRKLSWVTSPCGVSPYLDYFFANGKRTPYGRKLADKLPHCIKDWEEHGIIDSWGHKEIDRIRRGKSYLNVNPEFVVYRDWDRDTVIKLEGQEQLASRMMEALKTPLATWGEQL